MKINLNLIILSLLPLTAFPQVNLSFTPVKPVPGNTVVFSYTPPDKIFTPGDNIHCTAYLWGKYDDQAAILNGKLSKPVEVALTKKGNNLEGQVLTDSLTRAITLHFTSGKILFKQVNNKKVLSQGKIDHNDSTGYCISMYDHNDKELSLTNFSLGYYFALTAPDAVGFSNQAKAKEYLLREYELYPENALIVFTYLPYFLSENDKSSVEPVYKQAINAAFEKDQPSESDFNLAASLCRQLKLRGIAKYLNNEMEKKFGDGNGLTAYMNFWEKFETETNSDKKLEVLKQLEGKFQQLDYESKIMLMYNSALPISSETEFLQYALTKGGIEKYDSYSKLMGFTMQNYLGYPYMLKDNLVIIIDSLKNAPLAEKKGAEYISFLKEKVGAIKNKTLDPVTINPYLSISEIEQNILSTLSGLNMVLANAKSGQGDNKKAMEFCREAIYNADQMNQEFWDRPDLNTLFSKLAEKTMPLRECKAEVEKLVSSGSWTQEMVEILKRIYIKENKNENGFDTYLASLKKSHLEEMKKSLVASLLNEPAPGFTLSDLDGKTVNLADYRGKIVILDFWATWCGPCKASFPGMKKLQEAYANNPDIKLLFVDTFERFKTPEENIGRVKEYLRQNNYPFHVVLDAKNKVAVSYQVSGIPTKCIIDKNGNLRYKIIGAETNAGKLLDEMNAMIETIK